ncbi:uncharacterized protein G2W53_014508 [Senna tora]|uniref:Uncharacterized protein n=1 Tax=Senna tora TaxID=362788 RepID=A0A834WTM7_9FABA|nr:uncharacterized protein G2W53_014508 [Senna tora]
MQFRKKRGSKGEGSRYLTRLRTQIATVESCRSPSSVARRRWLLAVFLRWCGFLDFKE